MVWIIVMAGVLIVSLITVLYAVAHAMDYDPSWDEENDNERR